MDVVMQIQENKSMEENISINTTRTKTISKYFFDDEIIYKSGDIIYLKQGIRRRPRVFFTDYDELEEKASAINKAAKFMEKVEKAIQINKEERDFS